jgi:hypothetical protein
MLNIAMISKWHVHARGYAKFVSEQNDARITCVWDEIPERGQAWAEELGVPFRTFPAEILRAAEGDFTPSSFVAETTGVDNVCERAAWAAATEEGGSPGRRFILRKTARDGMTLAVVMAEVPVRF